MQIYSLEAPETKSCCSSPPTLPSQPLSTVSSPPSLPSWPPPPPHHIRDRLPAPAGPLLESKTAPQRDRALCQMVAHMSLDSIEETMETTGALYLRGVDRHNEWTVSAFIPTGVKFVLLHDVKNDDGIRAFFVDLWEAYVKILLNPFFTVNTPIKSPAFEARVKSIAKRHL
ncbi:hypothetical protein C345_05272 [Cryptococcus neoformans A2-102-5]|nr:hypothetical protein C345_05272 [Cryptococcus neoformans var. grubii A2-102-5]